MHGLVLMERATHLSVYVDAMFGRHILTVTLSLENGTSTVLYNFSRPEWADHMFALSLLDESGENVSHVDFRRVDVVADYGVDNGRVALTSTYFYVSRFCEFYHFHVNNIKCRQYKMFSRFRHARSSAWLSFAGLHGWRWENHASHVQIAQHIQIYLLDHWIRLRQHEWQNGQLNERFYYLTRSTRNYKL